MSTNSEYGRNFAMLKKCRRIHNAVSIIYAAMCIPYVIASLYLMLLSVSGDSFYLLFDGFVCKNAMLICGYLGAYKKSDKLAAAAPGVALLNFLVPAIFYNIGNYLDIFLSISGFNTNSLFLTASVILAALTIFANRKYRWLEAQHGFPYFNERFDEQNFQSTQSRIKSEYQQRFEELKKTESAKMDGLPSGPLQPQEEAGEKISGKMDEI